MIWWDFSNLEFLLFFSSTIILFAVIVFILLSNIVNRVVTRRMQNGISGASNLIRIFIIDMKHDSVIFFSRGNIKRKLKTTLDEFYHRFDPKDVTRLKKWMANITNGNQFEEDYLEIDLVSKGKKNYFSILKMIKYDAKVGLLHLESHRMIYVSPKSERNIKGNLLGNKHHASTFIPKNKMKEIIEKQKNTSGYTFCTRFYYKRLQTIDGDNIEKIAITNLKNILYGFSQNKKTVRYIVDEPGNELLLFDTRIDDKEEAIRFVTTICHELKKVIAVKGYKESIDFSIGVVENAKYYLDYNAIVKAAQQACIYAQQHNLSWYFYEINNKVALSDSGKYSQEITRLLKPNVLRYSFRPIVDTTVGKIIGYLNYVSAPESPFKSYMEMSNYSAKVHRNKEFFAYVSKNIISRYISEQHAEASLFLYSSLADIGFMVSVLEQIPNIEKCPLVLLFEESDFDDEEIDLSSINHIFEALRNMHIGFALLMHDENLLLRPEVYSYFDYFIIGSSMVRDIKKSRISLLSLHTLAEQLLKYKKTIIVTDAEGWQAIELVINSGITYISSETISAKSAMILPLDKKKADKLISISRGGYQ